MTRAAARGCDGLLDGALVAFAAWTVVYHVCLVAGIGSGWAAGAWVVLLAIGAAGLVYGLRRRRREVAGVAAASPASRVRPGWHALVVVGAVAGVAAGVAFGLTDVRYRPVWIAWLAASACVLAWATVRARAAARSGAGAAADDSPRAARFEWLEPATVAAWAIGLAVFSLFLLDPDADDAFYVHQSAWIAAHGVFPTRDVVFSDQVFPALYYPPVFSYEALVGTVSRITGLAVPDLVYLVVPPLASILSVLAFWRLLRGWRVPMAALALSATLVFLMFDAGGHMTFGSFFVNRVWQGKVLLLTILVPILFALLHGYGDRPGLRRLPLLLAAGIAAVGLSTTAIFLVPVIAGGCMLALLLRSPRSVHWALAGFLTAGAYPIAAGVVTKVGGGRTPDVYTLADVVPANLVHYVIGTGGFALLSLVAALAGPATIRRAAAAAMVAATVLLVGGLVSPHVPAFVFRHTGLGRVLWRLTWAMPVAALVGALSTGAIRRGPPLLRAVPAVALCAVMALYGVPVWSAADGTRVAHHPVLKRGPQELAAARAILRHAHRDDLILAPRSLSQTLLILSGRVTTVSPRGFFTSALSDVPAMHVKRREKLAHFARFGLRPVPASRFIRREIRGDLRVVGVDMACLRPNHVYSRRLLGQWGWRRVVHAHGIVCKRPPA
jgi:hypothetical protein